MVEYSLPGFSAYTVTDNGKLFVLKHLRHCDKRVEVKPNADGVFNIISDEGTRHRFIRNRIITSATSGLDPRDERVKQMEERIILDSLLPTTTEKVESADGKEKALSAVASTLKESLLSSLRRKGVEVGDGEDLRAEFAVNVLMDYYELKVECKKYPKMTTEISREGNERLVLNPLIIAKQKQAELARKEFASLGLSFEDYCKVANESSKKARELFDEADFTSFELV